MNILLIGKQGFSSGTFLNVKNIAWNGTTRKFTITRADDTTVEYSADLYYLSVLWN